jgi:hypothetical protein
MTCPTILLFLRVFVAAVKLLKSRCPAAVEYTHTERDWWEGFMKYAVEVGSRAMTCIQIFIKIGKHSKVNKGYIESTDTSTAWRSHKPTLNF